MREIKFKRYYQHDETGRITYQLWGKLDIHDKPVDDFGSFKSPTYMHRWFPFADCQFTGNKYKDGTEIYEGDIFRRTDTKDTFVVEWHKDGFDAHQIWDEWTKSNVFKKDKRTSISFWNTFNTEIIGNIYENRELLNDGILF